MANSGVLVGATAHTLSVVFEDGYNDHAQITIQEQKLYIQ